MKIFLLDLWHDLREKRLWPVAVALAVALVAVPVVLSKPASEPAVDAAAPRVSKSDESLKGLAKVVLANEENGKGSKLDLFDTGNPFRPPKSALKKDTGNGASSGAGSPSASSAGSDPGTSGSSGGVGGQGGSDGGGGGGSTPVTPPKKRVTQFTYVIDLTYTRDDRTRRIKGMKRLEMLPSSSSPLLLFLGVDSKASNAVFLVDSKLQTTGEGTCRPSADECSFVYLGSGSEHFFTDEDGTTYGVRIDQIRKVKVKSGASKARAGSRKRAPARTAVQQRRRFVPPVLLDLVSVSSDERSRSTKSSSRR